MGEGILEGIVLNFGNPHCKHERVFYVDNVLGGQEFWCDALDCRRHVRLSYSPGFTIRFPAGALISMPNRGYDGEKFYAFRADQNGEARALPRKFWEQRSQISVSL